MLHGGRLAYDGFAQLARTRVSFFENIAVMKVLCEFNMAVRGVGQEF